MRIIVCKIYGLIVRILARYLKKPFSNKNILLAIICRNHQKALYKYRHDDYNQYIQTYTPECDLLNFSVVNRDRYIKNDVYKIDDNGEPLVLRGGEYVRNVVVICQYALVKYGTYLKTRSLKDKEDFIRMADLLCDIQGESGEYLYYYDFEYYLCPNYFKKTGWTGAMQHGQALSVLYRASLLTDNPRFVECGDKIVDYLMISIKDGGVRGTLEDLGGSSDDIFFEEWAVIPETYTLNGFIFVLMGLYDWISSSGNKAHIAKIMFDQGVTSLEKIISLYDMRGGSTYDLGHITYNKSIPHYMSDYHAIHIAQLNILSQITNKAIFDEYFNKWKAIVD